MSSDAFSEVNVVKYALDRPGNRRREGEGRGGEGRGKEGEGRIKQGREGHWNRRMGNRNGGVAERKGKGDEKMGMKWKEREVQLLDPSASTTTRITRKAVLGQVTVQSIKLQTVLHEIVKIYFSSSRTYIDRIVLDCWLKSSFYG